MTVFKKDENKLSKIDFRIFNSIFDSILNILIIINTNDDGFPIEIEAFHRELEDKFTEADFIIELYYDKYHVKFADIHTKLFRRYKNLKRIYFDFYNIYIVDPQNIIAAIKFSEMKEEVERYIKSKTENINTNQGLLFNDDCINIGFDKNDQDKLFEEYTRAAYKKLYEIDKVVKSKIAEADEISRDVNYLLDKATDGSKEESRIELINTFNREKYFYQKKYSQWMACFILVSGLYVLFQVGIVYFHKINDINDFIIKFSILPVYIFVSIFLIGQYNRSRNLCDEYLHKFVVVSTMRSMEKEVDFIPDESRSIYYNTLFHAINRSPVEMLVSKKSSENDDDGYIKLLSLLIAANKK